MRKPSKKRTMKFSNAVTLSKAKKIVALSKSKKKK